MKNIFHSFFNAVFKSRWNIRKIVGVVLIPLGLMTVAAVFVLSSQLGLMLDSEPVCGLEEHTHNNDACYKNVLVCELEETAATETIEIELGTPTELEEPAGHTHNADCYAYELICGKTIHLHTEDCYTDEPEESTEPDDKSNPEICPYCESGDPHGHAYGTELASNQQPTTSAGGFIGITPTGIGDGWDLKNFVTGIAIKDADGKPVTNGNFYYGDAYTFTITFAERMGSGGQFSYNIFNKLVYQLPDELEVVTPVTNGVIYLSDGKTVVGSYTIDLSGRVEATFNNIDNAGNPISQNFINYYTNTNFKLDIKTTFEESAEAGKVQFGTNASITINVIGYPPATLKVEKSSTSFDATHESIDYTIKITAVGGTIDNIKFDDVHKFNILNYVIKNSDNAFNLNTGFKYTVNGANEQTIVPVWSGDALRFTFPTTVVLNAGDYITLKYTANLATVLNTLATTPGGIDKLQYSIRLDNTATVTGRDPHYPNEPRTGTATRQVTISKTGVSKSGTYDSTTNKINWTATVGNGTTNLNGQTITDTLTTSNHKIDGVVTIELYDLSGVKTEKNSGSDSGFAFNGTTGFTYNVSGAVYKIVFKYATTNSSGTSLQPSVGSTNYTNKIAKGDLSATATVTVKAPPADPGPGPIGVSDIDYAKKSEFVDEDGDGYVEAIKYTMTITVGAGNQGKSFYISDSLAYSNNATNDEYSMNPGAPSNTAYYLPLPSTTELLKGISIDPPDDAFKNYTAAGGGKYRLSTKDSLTGGIVGYATMGITFGNGSTEPGTIPQNTSTAVNSVWPYNDQRTITITYTTPLDKEINSSKETIRDIFNYKKNALSRIVNTLAIRIPDGASGNKALEPTAKHRCTHDYNPIVKSGKVSTADPTIFDYSIQLNGGAWENKSAQGNNAAMRHSLFKEGEPAIFEDEFNPKLEYVPGSFWVEVIGAILKGPNTIVNQYGCLFSGSGLFGDGSGFTETFMDSSTPGMIRVDLNNLCAFIPENTSSAAFNSKSNLAGYKITSTYSTELARYIVHYQLRLKPEHFKYFDKDLPDTVNQKIEFENTATVYGTSEKFAFKWSDDCTVIYTPPKPVKKNINYSSSSGGSTYPITDGFTYQTAGAEIEINPFGQRLRPANIESPYFDAIDTMSDNLAFYLSTMKIYYKEINAGTGMYGNWIQVVDPVTLGWGSYEIISDSPPTARFKIIDETPIRIAYNVILSTPEVSGPYDDDNAILLENKIEVYGESAVYTRKGHKASMTRWITTTSKIDLTVFKEDADTGKRLDGAEFELYMAIRGGTGGSNPNYYPAPYYDLPAGTATIEINGVTFYKVYDLKSTGNPVNAISLGNGMYKFDSVDGWISYAAELPGYVIVEKKEPTGGYILPAAPYNYTVVTLREGERAFWQGQLGSGVEVKLIGDNVTIKNKSSLASVVIKGRKNIERNGYTGTPPTFMFELTQVNSVGDAYPDNGPLKVSDLPIHAYAYSGATLDAFEFPAINGLKTGTYYFLVEEIDIPAAWQLKPSAPQIVKVVVDTTKPEGQKVMSVEYLNSSTNETVFTNEYQKPGNYIATIKGNKVIQTLNGTPNNELFTFTLTRVASASQDAAEIADGDVTYPYGKTASRYGAGAFDFPLITFATAGEYYFRVSEVSGTNPNWIYSEETYVVTINATVVSPGTNTVTYLGSATVATFTNKYDENTPKGKLEFTKIDGVTNNPLAGAKFELVAATNEGLYNQTGTVVQTQTSVIDGTKDGKITFTDIPEGIYFLREAQTPTNYKEYNAIYKVTVNALGGVTVTAQTLPTPPVGENPGFTGDYAQYKNYKDSFELFINVKKIVEHIDPTGPKNFTFKLEEVDASGTAKTYTQQITLTDATAGVYNTLKFNLSDFTFAKNSTYYFKVSEVNNTQTYGWYYDTNSYIVVVVIDASGNAKIYYPQSGNVTATNSTDYISIPPNGDITYKDGQYEFIGSYLAFCADKSWAAPHVSETDNLSYEWFRDSTNVKSSFAQALYTQYAWKANEPARAPDLKIFFEILGISGFYDECNSQSLSATQIRGKALYMAAFLVWYYEFKDLYPEYNWDPADFNKWPTYLPEKPYPHDPSIIMPARHLNIASYKNEFDNNGGLPSGNTDARTVYFPQAVARVDAIMANYNTVNDGKCVTSLEMIYEPDSDNSGWISFKYDGYQPQAHNLTFSWVIDLGKTVTIYKGSKLPANIVSGSSIPVSINDKFYIEYGSETGSVTFSLADDMTYLVNGSVKGKYFVSKKNTAFPYLGYHAPGSSYAPENDMEGSQRMICGYARFAKIKCALEIGNGSCVTFKNKYEEPTIDAAVIGNKTINGNNAPAKQFEFIMEELKDSSLASKTPAVTYKNKKTGAGEFGFSMTDLKPGTYYYRITETPGASGEGWTYDGKKYIVKVTVTYNSSTNSLSKTVEYSLQGGGSVSKIEFVNTYTSGGPKLPETGGNGIWLFILIGCIFVTFATAAGIFYKKFHIIRQGNK